MEENNKLENIPGAVSTNSTAPSPTVLTSSGMEEFVPNTQDNSELIDYKKLLSNLGHPNLPEEVIIKTFKENAAERNILLEANMIYTMKTIESLKALGYEMEEKD